MIFPYGKAPFSILLLAVAALILWLFVNVGPAGDKPDLVFVTFAKNHIPAYEEAIAQFAKRHNVKIDVQLVDQRVLSSRLQSALLTGADVPDMVELLTGTMGYFTRGPLEDVGFVDLTDRLHDEGLYDRLVASRFSLWSSRGRVFAIPHDVHPVMLCYRRDLVEELGIDVASLTTWDRFVAMGRRITKDLDGDGNPDCYAIDLPSAGAWGLEILIGQRGGGLFDGRGRVTFDTDLMAETILWYVHQTRGARRIAYEAGWGQPLAKAMTDGLVLFYICPDWRTKMFETDVPKLKGKLALMPLPAWKAGGRRTSTWGGTGLAITKSCRNQALAWKLAKLLYLKKEDLGKRFAASNIIPPVKDAWDLKAFKKPSEFYCGQRIGQLYAGLAPTTPPDYVSPYTGLAQSKLSEAFLDAVDHHARDGDDGLLAFTRKRLDHHAAYVRGVMDRNAFLRDHAASPGGKGR